jgi:LCP family protein required for cell wall assembly
MPESEQRGEREPPDERGERPDYSVDRARPRLLSRLPSPSLEGLREKLRRGEKPERPEAPPERPSIEPEERRRWPKWVLIGVLVWLLLSFAAFAVSAQLQKFKLDGEAADEVGGNPLMLGFPQNILVIGTDARAPGTQDGSEISDRCLEQGARGEPPSDGCGGFRADTLMVVRAGRGTFNKVSIPRDSFAEIPGHDPQKINAAYAFGGAGLAIRTVEQFLGVDIDHVVIVDFEGFQDFIDAIGGIEVDIPDKLCSVISGGSEGGGFEFNLEPGEHTLNGVQALTFARTRTNTCPEKGDSTEFDDYNDLDRAAAQQQVLNGIKGRLTSPLRIPINFIKGPIIGWTAPKAFVSDFGALTMPQLVISAAVGGNDNEVLKPSGPGPGASLIIAEEERRRAVDELLGG